MRLTFSTPLAMDYAANDPVNAILLGAAATSANMSVSASAGDVLFYVDNLGGGFAGTDLVVIDNGAAEMEVRRLGLLSSITLDLSAYADYPTNTVLQLVTMADDDRVAVDPPPSGLAHSATEFDLDRVDGLATGMQIDVGGSAAVVATVDADNLHITLQAALGAAPPNGAVLTPAVKALTGDLDEGRIVLALDNRLGIEADDVLRIGVGPDEEYATVAQVSGPRNVALDAGNVLLSSPVRQAHADGTEVRRQHPPQIDLTRQPAYLVLAGAEGATTVYVNDGNNYARAEIVSATLPSGRVHYHQLSGVDTRLAPRELELDEALEFSHDVGTPLVGREELIRVFALDRGGWGNRLLVAVEDLETPLVQADLTSANALNPVISLGNYTGVEVGRVLEFFDPATDTIVGDFRKVVSVDRAADEVELDAVPHPDVSSSPVTLAVRSCEFAISVFLLQRPDPAVPSRNDTIIDSERFVVSMDSRHSLYIHTVIGTTWTIGNDTDDDGNPLRLWDQRSEGESQYIRVRDVAAGNNAVTEDIRLGPEALEDILFTGQTRPAQLPLAGGDDSVDTMTDAMYQGGDSNEPRERTGIFALRNIPQISIVSVPGQTTAAVQQALINHCELDRYRFAVLDAHPPSNDTLADVQFQRQQFDTKYAALYHPWLLIPDPLPGNLLSIQQVPIPPSGHMLGIYARTDNTRGVHKAPANEVVRGITGLARYLNRREHDILNPFPVNINVPRDFRDNNRGLRVWGARCITSDTDFKYVNVRRLLIFIEASIDGGLQWVVFEPNAEPLWARMRRAISNFLTVVWRNGALEGTRPEQAFFVKCDRTTMTQTDIDNGRLICLVGVAPVKPAEFVIVRIGLMTANAQQ